jgi:hypothetical protein
VVNGVFKWRRADSCLRLASTSCARRLDNAGVTPRTRVKRIANVDEAQKSHREKCAEDAARTRRFRVHEARVAQRFKVSGRALLEIQFVDFL